MNLHDETFEQLYQEAPFGYLTMDAAGRILRVNDTLVGWLATPREVLLAGTFGDLLDPGARLFYETRHVPVLHLRGHVHEVSLTLRAGEGRRIPVLVNVNLVRDAAGDTRGARVAVLDATSRDEYERTLLAAQRAAETAAARVSVLQSASAAFGAAASERQLADSLAEIVADALAASAVCVAMLDDRGGLAVTGGTDPLDGMLSAGDRGPGDDVVESGRLVVVTADDPGDHPAVSAALRDARLDRVVVLPVLRAESAIGVVSVFFARERVLDEEAADLVISVARQGAQALHRIRLQDALAHLALHDQLTGLPNRALLRENITQAIAAAERAGASMAVMFIDLDGFKPINDRRGHNAGDTVLREVARRVRAAVRESDSIGRYGGDEFVVICADADGAAAESIAERLRAALREPYPDADGMPVSASVGIALYAPEGRRDVTTDVLLDVADTAMYESKRGGRDRTTLTRC